jgi:two-component system, sensor histidine kinase and response regulator
MKQDRGMEEVGAPAPGRELPHHRPEGEGARAAVAASLRVLLAEDNVTNQLLARRILEKRGYVVVVVENGKAAIEAVERESFDVVLMDVQMPELSGIDATLAIRRREAGTGRHIPIIALTAHVMKSDVETCLVAGMDAFLSKPVRPPDLASALELVLAGAPVRDLKAQPDAAPPAIDRVALLAGTDGDVALLELLVSMFPVEIPALVASVRSAVLGGDAVGLVRAAHRLKGTLGNFAARRAVEATARLEAMGQSGEIALAPAVLADLEREIGRVSEALAQLAA